MVTEIKKTASGYEIDGIAYAKLEDAEEHRKELMAGDIGAVPSWAGEKVEYVHRPEEAKSFALFLEDFLTKNSMTLSAFAKGVGVSRKAVYEWMSAKTYPEERQIEAIAHFTGATNRDVKLSLTDNFLSNNESYLSAFSLTEDERKALQVISKTQEYRNDGLRELVDAVVTISEFKKRFALVRAISKLKGIEKNVDGQHALQKLELLIKTV